MSLYFIFIFFYLTVVNIWSGSKKFIKVVLRQERILVLGFRTTLMKGFDPLQMLTTAFYFLYFILFFICFYDLEFQNLLYYYYYYYYYYYSVILNLLYYILFFLLF